MLWKKLLETKESPMALFPIFSQWKTEVFHKKEIKETFNNCFVGANLAASTPESKTTFQNYIHYDDLCLSTINFQT